MTNPNHTPLVVSEEVTRVLYEALTEIAAMGDGRKLNWGDAQDAIDIAKDALNLAKAGTL